jgi:leucine-zipper of insertion element IS481
MPWLETDVRDQRIQFVMTVRRGGVTVTEACRAFGISRKTGYKWLGREAAAGSVAVLIDRSRRPHVSPRRTTAAITRRIGELRRDVGWGGAKLATCSRRKAFRSRRARSIELFGVRAGRVLMLPPRRRCIVSVGPRRMTCGKWMRRGVSRRRRPALSCAQHPR